MKHLLLYVLTFCAIHTQAQDVPFLSTDDFEFKLDYGFETKPPPSQDRREYDTKVRYSAGPLPYVKVNFKFVDLPENAFRVRVLADKETIKNKKLKRVEDLDFDLGFADDIKDRVEPHAYYIYLENKNKERLSLIKIFVEETGDFYLNDKLYGKI